MNELPSLREIPEDVWDLAMARHGELILGERWQQFTDPDGRPIGTEPIDDSYVILKTEQMAKCIADVEADKQSRTR